MKVLLIKHPTTHFRKTAPPVSGIPLGLLYVAATLLKAGHEVRLYDAIVEAGEKHWGKERSDGALHMGASWEEIKRTVTEFRPDIVGISNQYTSQVPNALRVADIVKEVNRNILVIVGGPHASVMPSTFINARRSVDYAVIGEGEITMVELLGCIASKGDRRWVKGIAYFENAQLVMTEKRPPIGDLDSLPLPAYGLVDMERYFYFNKKGKDGRESYSYPSSERSISMITSRGCPFNCVFCSVHLSMGRVFRVDSVGYVLEHLSFLKQHYHITHVHFEDDNFSFDTARFHGILDGLLAGDSPITWDTPNGVRADYLDEAILRKCRDSGCTYLRIGVESANEDVSAKIVRKHLDLGKVVAIAKLCRQLRIDVEAFYIIGFPGENVAQMKDTINFAIRMELKYGLYPYDMFTATPLIGTDLYRICEQHGYLSREVTSESLATATQGAGMITTPDFTPQVLKALLTRYRRRHLFARLSSSLKFMALHPQYLLLRFANPTFLPDLWNQLAKLKLLNVIESVVFYRYKNCVIRKVGL